MKKILLVTILASLLALPALALPAISLAIEEIPPGPTTPEQLIGIIETIANWMFAILLAVALIFILMAAFQFLTSGGDPMRVEKARMNLLYAVIGIAVAFLARGFVALVRLVLGVTAPAEEETLRFFIRFFS